MTQDIVNKNFNPTQLYVLDTNGYPVPVDGAQTSDGKNVVLVLIADRPATADESAIPFAYELTTGTQDTDSLINQCACYGLKITHSGSTDTFVVTGIARQNKIFLNITQSAGAGADTIAISAYLSADKTVESAALGLKQADDWTTVVTSYGGAAADFIIEL